MNVYSPDTFIVLLFFGLLGLGFGSFGNMMLYRIAIGKAFTGRSFCPHCRHTLAWYDLVPVLSYVFLLGRCRYCRMRISSQYPLVEIVTLALFLWALFLHLDNLPLALIDALLLWGLLLVVVYDAKYQLIPDLFTLIVFVCALVTLFVGGQSIISGAIGCIIGLVWFGAQWLASRGRYVGSGDILLGASLGLWLGWKGAITMLFLAYILGAIWAVQLLIRHQANRKTRIAFGPLLALGAVIASLGVGDWYFGYFGL